MSKLADPFPRAAGVLLHLSSLPSPHGIGDVGAGARAFVDFLSACGAAWWQMLPVGETGPGYSPYSSTSSFAANPYFIDVDALTSDGLVPSAALTQMPSTADRVDWEVVLIHKQHLLQQAAKAFVQDAAGVRALVSFVESSPWAIDHALFTLCSQLHRGPWWQWPMPIRKRDRAALDELQREHASALRETVALQLLFAQQWTRLQTYAAARHVRLMGDMPIYVDGHSVDVWSAPHLFALDDDGAPQEVAGVPPDVFSATGQLWGNPLYRWPAHAADGHRFFVERLRQQLVRFDAVRIDHFRGFAGYYAIPAGSQDATTGTWQIGPGQALFDDVKKAFGPGPLPFIAEDLGVITPDVVSLRKDNDLPGMKILQFAFGGEENNDFLPHRFGKRCVVYTGTHDNDTTLGFYQGAEEHVRDHMRRYLARDGSDIAWDLIRAALSSVADTAIIPMQDLLSLDNGARMNIPGTSTGNWGWRVRIEAFHPDLAQRFRDLVILYDRTPS
jgi:4-alpha-glucanotransferase